MRDEGNTVLDIENALMELEELRDVSFVSGLFETCISGGGVVQIPEYSPTELLKISLLTSYMSNCSYAKHSGWVIT